MGLGVRDSQGGSSPWNDTAAHFIYDVSKVDLSVYWIAYYPDGLR